MCRSPLSVLIKVNVMKDRRDQHRQIQNWIPAPGRTAVRKEQDQHRALDLRQPCPHPAFPAAGHCAEAEDGDVPVLRKYAEVFRGKRQVVYNQL